MVYKANGTLVVEFCDGWHLTCTSVRRIGNSVVTVALWNPEGWEEVSASWFERGQFTSEQVGIEILQLIRHFYCESSERIARYVQGVITEVEEEPIWFKHEAIIRSGKKLEFAERCAKALLGVAFEYEIEPLDVIDSALQELVFGSVKTVEQS